MKKIIIIWGLIALVIIICLCIPYWVDDFACEQYKIEVEKVIAEVDDISMIDTLNGCGNVTTATIHGGTPIYDNDSCQFIKWRKT